MSGKSSAEHLWPNVRTACELDERLLHERTTTATGATRTGA